MSASLKIANVSKVFDHTVALNNVNLEIQAGEFICLLGPSGCGKSTLLRLIAGLEKPSSGKIYIGDRDVTNLPPSRRNFGIMFQSYALFPNLTAFENVAYGLRNKKIKAKDIEDRVNRLFDMIRHGLSPGEIPFFRRFSPSRTGGSRPASPRSPPSFPQNPFGAEYDTASRFSFFLLCFYCNPSASCFSSLPFNR